MNVNHRIKTLALSGLTLLILLMMILWMAGAFQRKIEPGDLSDNSRYLGPSYPVEYTVEPRFEQATGTVTSRRAGDISAEVQARIVAIHVKAGDTVVAGDRLVTLDAAAAAARTAQAKQNSQAIAARLRGAEAHYRRTKTLFDKNSATRADFDDAKSAYDSLRSQAAAAEAQLRESVHVQQFNTLRADFGARVIDRYAEPGEIAYPGRKLLSLYDPSALRVEADIRESAAVGLIVGQTLDAYFDALDLTLPATIEEIVPAANPAGRSVRVKLRITEREGLFPGMFARLRLPRGDEKLLAVPQDYVHQVGQLDVVWLLNDQRVERRFVRLGDPLVDGRIKVVSGLAGGERLVPPSEILASGNRPH